MKNFKAIIGRVLIGLHLFVFVLPALAAAPSGPGAATNAVYEWETARAAGATTFSNGGVTFPDTLTGTGDSAIILKDYAFQTGAEYMLVKGPAYTTLTTGDSVVLRADFKDASKNYLFSVYFDTVVAASAVGGCIVIPVNRVAYAPYVSIVEKSLGALSTRIYVVTSRIHMNKRRPVNVNQSWK